MSRISRRSLLGYSGTATAGAVLGSAAAAQPALAAEADTEAGADAVQATETASAAFPAGTLFSGTARSVQSDLSPELTIRFGVGASDTPAAMEISPLEIAEALNELAATKGWPPITFYGTPAPAPLN